MSQQKSMIKSKELRKLKCWCPLHDHENKNSDMKF
jgi:hypothetical protein